MKKCSSCGIEAPDDSTFCESCGAGFSAAAPPDAGACPSCGTANESGSTFCANCGASLTAAAEQATPGGGGVQRFIDRLTLPRVLLGGIAFGALIGLAIVLFTCSGDSGGGGGSPTSQPQATDKLQATETPTATERPQETDQPAGGGGFPTVADAIADAMMFAGFVGHCDLAALDPGDLCYVEEAALAPNIARYAVGAAFSEFYALVVLEQLPDGTYAVNSVSDFDLTGGGEWTDIADHLTFVYADAFVEVASEWPVGDEDDGEASRSRSLSNGSYTLALEADSGWIAPETIEVGLDSEFYVAAEVYMQAGDDEDSCGIVVAAASSFPRLELLVLDGSSEFEVLFGEQSLSFLVEPMFSTAIFPGEDNHLGIFMDGSQATFIINGAVVATTTVPAIDVRRLGVVTATGGSSGFTSCEFNFLEVRS